MSNIKYKALFLMSGIGLLLLTGCTKNLKYHSKPLQPLKKGTAKTGITKNNVTVCAKKLNSEDCKYYFNEKKLRRAKAIQIAIENNSNTQWILSKNNINLNLRSSDYIKHKLQAGVGKSIVIGLLIPVVGIIHGVASHRANQRISKDIDRKSLIIDTLIEQHIQKDVLVYVSKNANTKNFSITLIDANNHNNRLQFNLSA